MTGSIRTLIVDDDASVRLLHARYLGGISGFTVLGTVGTGADAVQFAAENDVDLILLDMHLPDYSGIEVLHRLRSLTLDAIDVIVVTSANELVTVRQAAAARVADYLVKPFSRAVFELRLTAYRAQFGAAALAADSRAALKQDDIDGLVGPRSIVPAARMPAAETPPPARLPKGLAEPTISRILEAIAAREVSSSTEIARDCGLARGTARRYLDYLRAAGLVTVTHRYGVPGRPELLYSRAPG